MSSLMYNEIYVTGYAEDVNKFIAECTVDGYLSFGKCIPMPKKLQPKNPKNLSQKAYAWRQEHWGTGFDCYDISESGAPFEVVDLPEKTVVCAEADFDTENFAPMTAINALSDRYKELSFFVNSLAEDGSIKDICDDMETYITFESALEDDADRSRSMEDLCERISLLRDDAYDLETSFTHLLGNCALSGYRDTFDAFELTVSHKIEERDVAAHCIRFLKQVEKFEMNLKEMHDDLIALGVQEQYNEIGSNLAFFRAFVAKILVQLNL